MKKSIITAALCVVVFQSASAQSADPLATPAGWEIGGQLSDYRYEEPTLGVKLWGPRVAVTGAYTFVSAEHWFLKFDGASHTVLSNTRALARKIRYRIQYSKLEWWWAKIFCRAAVFPFRLMRDWVTATSTTIREGQAARARSVISAFRTTSTHRSD
jgi:hypothetical protein